MSIVHLFHFWHGIYSCCTTIMYDLFNKKYGMHFAVIDIVGSYLVENRPIP